MVASHRQSMSTVQVFEMRELRASMLRTVWTAVESPTAPSNPLCDEVYVISHHGFGKSIPGETIDIATIVDPHASNLQFSTTPRFSNNAHNSRLFFHSCPCTPCNTAAGGINPVPSNSIYTSRRCALLCGPSPKRCSGAVRTQGLSGASTCLPYNPC